MAEGWRKVLSQMLQEELRRKRFSIRLLAQKLGVSDVTLGKWIHLEAEPDAASLRKIASYFKLSESPLTEMANEPLETEHEILLKKIELRLRPLSPVELAWFDQMIDALILGAKAAGRTNNEDSESASDEVSA